MENSIKPKDILRKEPFKRILPADAPRIIIPSDGYTTYDEGRPIYQIVSQADFLREYEVSGHKINSEAYYPNRIKKDDKGNITIEIVARTAFPFQYIITIKQLTHLCGNNIEFKLSDAKPKNADYDLLKQFQQGWIDHNMETAWYYAARSEKITGDVAFCGAFRNGKFYYQVFSYLNGDVLYPYHDPVTGDLIAFGRTYKYFNAESSKTTTCLDVWDETYIYHYERSNGILSKAKRVIGLDGWVQIGKSEPHGFPFLPIVYKRSPIGPCWSPSQDNIENYELAVSQLCENNKAFAFPILFTKGGELEMQGSVDGRAASISAADSDADAKLLDRSDASGSFELQLRILLENIFRGSFAVNPPEIKGGDMPGITVKLLYSPALEKAMADSQEWNDFVDGMVKIFKYGYGIEIGKSAELHVLKVRGEIIPYVHQNVAELIANLVQLKASGLISTKTASGQTTYGTNAEDELIEEEERRKIQRSIPQNNTVRTTSSTTAEDEVDGNIVNKTRSIIAEAQSR